MSSPDAKTAEFAKLFDLFEMLATRRSRRNATEPSLEDMRAIPVPAELEPVFRSLAAVVTPPSGRRRRNTVAALGRTTHPDSDGDSDSDGVESDAKFPLGKTYTFTFKMMIHKLYEVEEWAQKVRDVLKKSQIEYKPLAEREEVKGVQAEAAATPVADGRVHFKTEVTIGGKKSMPLAQGRTRSHSVAGSGRTLATTRVPVLALSPTLIHDDARAVKKRCIGRRKSVSGPIAPVGEGWIYDAAISSAEVREHVSRAVEATPTFTAPPRPRPRYQSLQSGSRRMGFGPRRIVSAITHTPNEAGAVVDNARVSTKRRLSQ